MFCFLTLPLIFCSSFQRTALHDAAIVGSMLQWTALHGAAYGGHTAVCEVLIAGKADVDAKDECAFIF